MLKPVVGGFVGTLLLLSAAAAQSQIPQRSPQVLSQTLPSRGANIAISPLELQQFVQALKQLQRVEMETREKMAEALKEEKLSPERFQEIGQQRSNPDFAVTSEITPSEQQRFDKALAKIQTVQQEAAPKQSRAITLQGLSVERFNQIGQAVEKSPALRQELRNKL